MKLLIAVTFFVCVLFQYTVFAQKSLPVGTHPPALTFDHFPNRSFAFVWRNWNLVSPEKMAETIKCKPADILNIAQLMGLENQNLLPNKFQDQIYISLLRRNWHLLPYEQLLTLLDMDRERLEFALKEDDFLFHKFGNLKPACPELHYTKPTDEEIKMAVAIKELIRPILEKNNTEAAEDLFEFIDDLKTFDEKIAFVEKDSLAEDQLRFIYSYFGIFGDPLMDEDNDPFPNGLLQKLAQKGVNGVWMHVVLGQLAPQGEVFPEFGEGSEIRLMNLQKIARRAKKFGIDIYLYMNEPRAQPQEFFEQRPQMAGVNRDGFTTMCTSDEQVRNWMEESLTHVFTEVPELGGVFTITASENLTNCASHGGKDQCPRCSKRPYEDIIAEVNRTIANGVHAAKPEAKVIAWDWGWNGHGMAREVIDKLPEDVWLMSVSEWAKPIERGGVSNTVGEYSISAVGPGPRAKSHWSGAKKNLLKTVAKVQFNNTWELSVVPWLPVMDLVARHAANLAQMDIDGVMLSWTLGSYPSPNLEIAKKFSDDPDASIEEVLNSLALERYGRAAVPYVRNAWTTFSSAFEEYPYDIRVVYAAPQQYGPSNLLFLKPTGYRATMVGFPYDDLKGWSGPYPPETLISQFEKMANNWEKGLKFMEGAIEATENVSHKKLLEEDLNLAKAAYLHFQSVGQQGRFIMARDMWLESQKTDKVLKDQVREILEQEKQTAIALLEVSRKDSRIGFEASNQYYYVPQDLLEKVINCQFLINELD
ncbi:hypothetical protein [Cyclobacterium marinum]|uniref:Beta-hexosaminidase bacterial type N-terminal domain-containing protein n=1 Tax=Cyclobacterium marinum (strain ATCC 25205 / DSM 745 / LMG 13164 / NCIMB 1802) TaxID=880070 RepID=G0IYB9_CYCMS|nr:hypothetical protein [Cyclobacterium marinum]AEL25654.1 hypothetical protein Cycma_1902 [Cyclobacterium marinum DSM 745]